MDSPVIICIIAVTVVALISVASSIWEARNSTSDEENKLLATIAEKKAAIFKLSPVADFVEVSLLQRGIISLEKKLATAKAAPKPRTAAILPLWRNYASMVCVTILTLVFWGTPVAYLPPFWAAPFGWALALPDCRSPAISVATWSGICVAVIPPAVWWLAEVTGVYVAPPATPWLTSLMQSFMR